MNAILFQKLLDMDGGMFAWLVDWYQYLTAETRETIDAILALAED